MLRLHNIKRFCILATLLVAWGTAWGDITPTTPSTDASGVYQIGTAEELWGFAQGVNNGTIAVSANAKLTCATSIDLGGSANGSFPGIGSSSKVYTGTFDGNGKTIGGYYQSCTSTFSTGLGFFKNVKNATIKNFTLVGTLSITGSSNTSAFLGGVIGKAETSQIIDVTSTVDINTDNTVSGETDKGIRIVGGVASWSNGSAFTRCRYNGTMTLYSNDVSVGIGDRFAGIVGFAQTGATTIENCLFDGKIEAFSNSLKIAGIMGRNDLTTSQITNCLSVGTLKLLTVNTTTGMIMGFSNKQPVITKSYYTKDKFTVNNTEVGSSGYNTAGTLNDGSDWESLTNALNNNAVVGETANWKIVSGQAYPIPMEYTIEAAGPYSITFDTKGGTTINPIVQDYGTPVTAPADPTKTGYVFAGWDRDIPTTMPGANITITAQWTYTPVDNYYLISTKEDFFNFATVASTNASANAKLLEDIDLEEETFNGFTGYKGSFDGNKKTIKGYKRTFTSGSSSLGFFNTTNGATIKDFTLEGEEIYNINSACYAIGGVIGMANSTTIEGVTSKVKMTFGANCPSGTGGIRVVGGLIGRINGGSINKCRYNGTIDLSANSGISDRFGGIVGDLGAASTISNCLFDGEIKVAATSSLMMGGILGGKNNQTPTIQHCLFNGKMTFPTGANISNCGPISGGTGVTASDSYYDMTGFTVGGTKQAKTAVQQSSSIERTTQPWLDICVALNNGSSNWGIGTTEGYPVPGASAPATYTLSFNTDGGSPEIDSQSLPQGATINEPSPAPTKTGYTLDGWYNGNVKVTFPMTMPANAVTLKAKWNINQYTLAFEVNGGTAITSVTQDYNTTYTLPTAVKTGYRFDGWNTESDGSGTSYTAGTSYTIIGNSTLYAQYTFVPNAQGVFEIANQEDLFNFAAYVNATGLGTGNGHGNTNAKLLNDITLDGTTAFPGIGKYVSGDQSYAYSGTFDGQGHSITGYVRNVTTNTNQGGMFNYVVGATIKNFSLAGTMTVSCNAGQQYGSVIGWSEAGSTIEDVHSSVNVTITSTAAQVGGFTGRAGGTYNRCRYSGTVSTSTAYNKIGGFAGSHRNGTTTNCLFDGTLDVTTSNDALIAGGFTAAVIEAVPNSITNCLTNGTITITNKNAKCGIIFGFADKNITLTNALYTTTNATGLDAIGTVSGATMTGVAKDVTSETWNQILAILNPTSGTEGNWEIKTGKDYPVPSPCTIAEHEHQYTTNGFCISGDAYEAAVKDADGYYKVTNAGNLWWLATEINAGRLAKTTNIKLMNDIDMESDAHGSFPGFCPLGTKSAPTAEKPDAVADDWTTAYQGNFNGQGHTINNYYRLHNVSGIRRGLFNSAFNATIRNFKINGEVKITTTAAELALSGVVLGSATGATKIEDIHSSVNVTAPAAQIRGFGGVAGALEDAGQTSSATMERCRYSGTITLNGNTQNQNIGGVLGELRSAKMYNCLFDGKIIVASTVPYTFIGGLVGKVGSYSNSEIHRALVHGTITLNGYSSLTDEQKTAKSCGIVIGGADRSIYLNKVYHTTTNVTTGLNIIGPHTTTKVVTNENDGVVGSTITVDLLLGTSADKTGSCELYDGALRQALGTSNWAAVENVPGKYTYPLKDEAHIHKYNNGFCTANDGDYQQPNITGTDEHPVYQISNGGNLYWFAEHFNAGEIPDTAIVEIMKDINMEGNTHIYPGIGTSSYKFKGQFLGHDHRLYNYHRDIVNAEGTGLINYAEDVTIKEIILEGTLNFNLSTTKSFHGTVVGMCTGASSLIEDVSSSVNVNMNNEYVRVFGGIAGRSSGTINRCQYSGTMICSGSGQQIGGILANAKETITISNCLFAGKIDCTDATHPVMRVSGILSSNEKGTGATIVIKNCLFNGCLEVDHTYVEPAEATADQKKSTENGIIAGYWDSNKPSIINNVFFITSTNCTMENVPVGAWATDPTKENYIKIDEENSEYWTEQEGPKWEEIFNVLDEVDPVTKPDGNGDWQHNSGSHPVPNDTRCKHYSDTGHPELYFDEFGYCTLCGFARPLEKDPDGTYHMDYIADLASFRDMVNSATEGSNEVFNATLTEDIDFANFEGDFGEPIGNNYYNRYLYNFDGQGHTLKNVKITTQNQYVGFFGFAGDPSHDCQIHDFTITGTIEVPYSSDEHDDAPLYMGVVGKMFRGSVYNVHSQLEMKNTNPTRAVIGGIVGCIETPEGNDENGNPYAVIIDKCSYTGTSQINAVGNFGGILGQSSRHTEVKNCTFSGNMIHSYAGENNTTNLSGIVGYNEEPTFKGVKNSVIAGVLKTDANRAFSEYGQAGNHKNVLCGEDKIITNGPTTDYKSQYSGNYAWDYYNGKVPTNSVVFPEWVSMDKLVNGEVCAILNSKDDAPGNNQNGHPWGQVLGYQLDLTNVATTGSFLGNHTEGSPAQRVPLPGYQNPEKKVNIVKSDASGNYTVDWYYFDDKGDATPIPATATSMKVKKIEYHRDAEYLKGFNSVVLPFTFTQEMKPNSLSKIYLYDRTEGSTVHFLENTSGSIPAGTPFILYCYSDDKWDYVSENSNGTSIAIAPVNPSDDGSTAGIYGSYNTIETGWGFWKLDQNGERLVKTIGPQETAPSGAPTDKPISHCYPYRAYMKLPSAALPVSPYRPVFGITEVDPSELDFELTDSDGNVFSISGQRVNANANGIVIINGKKVLKR